MPSTGSSSPRPPCSSGTASPACGSAGPTGWPTRCGRPPVGGCWARTSSPSSC
ncbi:hypothetical protein [Ornithinimicrobium kibberense]|uniref:hypothetical protein n=1 Tax=Ornithinimicrobium kibberense TaxID=282060 RepID=UPI00361E1BB4